MKHSHEPFLGISPKLGIAWSGLVAILAGMALSMNLAMAQEGDANDEDEEALELRDVKVTGSRLSRPASELSGNLIVLDREAIRASGELTLARVLRQLPQNVNATNETYGSQFNGAENKTGAASVNLRGLGSESTLILVDGRRVGYSGILGGVTDISTIPLSMVDRIEILLDGASALYGSDAVGGVVNIITRKDYSGVELDINYGRPHKSGYNETRASLTAGFAWDGGRGTVGYEYFRDSGLDASLRDSIIVETRSSLQTAGQKNTEAGPQIRVWTNFYDDECNPDASAFDRRRAVVFELDGRILSRSEYDELDADSKAAANCVNDLTLPLGFQHTDDLNTIDLFGEQHWGEEAELGFSLRPEQRYDTVTVGIDQEISPTLMVHANIRYGKKESSSENGLNHVSGSLHPGNPYNPFGTRVSITGLSLNTPPSSFESERDELFARVGAEGSLGGWNWQAEFSRSSQEADTTRFNVRDRAYGAGINTDGVSEARLGSFSRINEEECEARRVQLGGIRYTWRSIFGGNCTVYGPPPDPINPFGDLNPYIIPDVDAGSENEQTQFEALARGELFSAPGGAVAVVVGYDFRQDVLDSFSEFRSCCAILPSSSATGDQPFNTRISRDNHAAFFEGLIPLVGSDNAFAGVQRLSFTFSGRYDSYSNVEVEYRQTEIGEAGTLDAADPGREFTWSTGLVYRPTDTALFKANLSTSFVAPQLNQLLSKVEYTGTPCLWHYTSGGGIGQICDNVFEYRGGNDSLTPESADSLSLTAEFSPSFLPGIYFKASWSDTEFVDRIHKLSVPIVYLDALPSNVLYNAEGNIYVVDTRWINVSSIERSGMDYELRYEWQTGLNDYSIMVRRSYTNRYQVQLDATAEIVHDLVTTRDDSGPEDTTIPPVPKHQTSAQFTWTRGGLFLSLDVQGADTTVIMTQYSGNYVTEPATNYDLVLGYELGNDSLFDAAWMNNLEVTLTINNLTNAFARNSRVNRDTGERTDFVLNSFYEWTQGRSYRLAIHKSF